MKRTNIDRDWHFIRSWKPSYFYMLTMGAETVHLPHDFTIETDPTADSKASRESGFYEGGVGCYTKHLDIPADWENARVMLEIDGAYRNAEVVLNGHQIVKQHNGYFPFHADLTPYLNFGEQNRVTIAVNNEAPNGTRWYTGTGIYRHVDLLVSPEVHLAPWSIFFHTQRVDEDGTAYCMAEITVENRTAKTVVEYINFELEKDGSKVSSGRVPVSIPPLGKTTGRVPLVVENAAIWDTESPQLYTAKATLDNGDSDETTVGIRMVTVDTKHGLRLNGRTVKLKGGCVHSDNGIIGAVSLFDAEYRKLKLLKDSGYNAIRCAHNPPSRDMLDACDQLGLLVINEAFDCWKGRDANYTSDYHLMFDSQWKTDLEYMMKRDRNHPSIIMWSTGNEIYERNGLSGGYALSAEIADLVRQFDPTRLVTCAIPSTFNGLDDHDSGRMLKECQELVAAGKFDESTQNMNTPFAKSIWGPRTEPFAAPLDVVGYNYIEDRYEEDGVNYPNRIICGQESFAKRIDVIWDLVERLPYVIGDFTWTAFDYIGEAGLGQTVYLDEEEAKEVSVAQGVPITFPWRTAFCGDFDICGFTRPQLHYRRIVWGSVETYIAAGVPANENKQEIAFRWAWPECYEAWNYEGYEGHQVSVAVYSRADEVELMLNGKSIGIQPAGKANRYTAAFKLEYQPGTLVAISRTNGKEVSRSEIVTTGKVAAIRLVTDKQTLNADGNSLAYITVELVDEQGRVVPFEDKLLKAAVTGVANLAGFGTGLPTSTENYTKGEFTSWLGKCLAVLRSDITTGEAVLRVEADGISPAEIKIQIN